ncbi:heme chaperone HemW [Macadamia integrifolia]|uniref:heme chaperone HemW n=1 Tax=Macadamia integrifolia TaxID=60698 RepID=UPI001C4EF540|nr:heme chaperone HemW [Macadamia integrifolia]
MLRQAFNPIVSAILPTNFKIPVASRSISNAILHNPRTVRENASPNNREHGISRPTPLTSPTSAYVHLPFCRKRCHYCDFAIVALGSSSSNMIEDDPRITNYVQLLCREIEATTAVTPPDNHQPLETIFFGGGTPSLVPPRLISRVIDSLRSKFGLHFNAEISIEMDPGTFDTTKMRELLALGVNRVSLGVQAFQEELLRECGRAHGVQEVYEALDTISSCGLANWSMDLISSLPHQTPEMWEESLKLTIEARPTHVSVYDLQVEQDTKFGALYTSGEFPLPSETQSAQFYRMASEKLSNAGYDHYEISSYCKSGFECKHNLTYWKNKPFYAFGLGSASYIDGVRFSRPRKMKEFLGYVQNLEDGLVNHIIGSVDAKDTAMDVVMLSFRTARGLDLRSFAAEFGSYLPISLCKALGPYMESGHVIALDEKRKALHADELGFMLSNEKKIEELVHFLRLSDPDGFLLSNELISVAFAAMSP